mgnify:CR=1 FL=1
MAVDNEDLPALIGSRICHDLISPIGAITNGLELLEMVGAVQGPEMELISGSVGSAGARIRFFRIAFGQASPDQLVGRAEILSILSDVYRGGRLKVHWTPAGDCPRAEVRQALLLLQCLETAMPYGGQIHISRTDSTWRVQGEADKLKVDPTLFAALNGKPQAALSAAQVHFILVPEGLRRMNRTLKMEQTENRIAMTF